ncbi:PREDICTED: protein yippee-like At3g55890 isoform X3 [Tarenaya hassleriana]|nr:PREDICTED: protein yippee-like At3g55890 isoform X3 [Tarenaya hassleriana]
MGRLFVVNLEGKIYSCKHCKTHLAVYEDIISKSFHCRHGKAYLFNKVVNVSMGENEDRMMMTGLHTVADIFCVGCGSIVGWRYEMAHEKSQKYKEGKSVLERSVLRFDRQHLVIDVMDLIQDGEFCLVFAQQSKGLDRKKMVYVEFRTDLRYRDPMEATTG